MMFISKKEKDWLKKSICEVMDNVIKVQSELNRFVEDKTKELKLTMKAINNLNERIDLLEKRIEALEGS